MASIKRGLPLGWDKECPLCKKTFSIKGNATQHIVAVHGKHTDVEGKSGKLVKGDDPDASHTQKNAELVLKAHMNAVASGDRTATQIPTHDEDTRGEESTSSTTAGSEPAECARKRGSPAASGAKPVCAICHERYSSKSNLTQHIVRIHGKDILVEGKDGTRVKGGSANASYSQENAELVLKAHLNAAVSGDGTALNPQTQVSTPREGGSHDDEGALPDEASEWARLPVDAALSPLSEAVR